MKTGMLTLILISLFSVIAISGGITYIVMNGNTEAIVAPTCSIQSSTSTATSYTCPTGSASCAVKVTLSCNTQTATPKVKLRWSDNSFRPAEIALDKDGDGDLDRLVLSETQVANNIPLYIRFPEPISSSYVAKDSTKIAVCAVTSGGSTNCRVYVDGGSISTSLAPTEPYTSTGRELRDGTITLYQCTQQVTGAKTLSVSYAGNAAGTKVEQFTLSAGQSINWNGKIESTVVTQKSSECTKNEQGNDPSTYYICNVDSNGCGVLSKTVSTCQAGYIYDEAQQKCNPPYTSLISLDKSLFLLSEDVTGSVTVAASSQVSYIPLRISVLDALDREITFTYLSTDTTGKRAFNLGKIAAVGDYKIKVEIDHPAGKQIIYKSFAVTNPIFIRLAPDPDVIQYTSDTIKAKAFITGTDNQPKSASNWDFTGSKCGALDVSKQITVDPVQLGVYELSTAITSPCTLILKAVAVDSANLRSNPDLLSIEVRQSSVIIKADLSAMQDQDEGRYTVTFQTLDTNLQPIETDNLVIVKDANACESGKYCVSTNTVLPSITPNRIGNGLYSFSYDFKAGLNVITIQSVAKSSTVLKNTQEFPVNLFRTGQSTPNSETGVPLELIIGGIVLVGGVGIFIYIISRKRKA
ncbi:carbohydrate-binding module family 14 protein [Candidatus Dojkabacteria bacterium]|jgi:hypothetical protein|nr:carbohydrate-binding module family 14 protein [Candidatus Dojkabacteria bacterium]